MQPVADQYNRYRHALKGESLPCAFVDLSHFDRNIETVAEALRYTGKFVRIHSKSLRCPTLIRRILDRGGPLFQGVMTFHMRETAFLAEQGFDDFIVAYPSFEKADLEAFAKLTCRNVCVRMMVDSIEHLDRLEEIGRRFGTVLKTCLEIDLSYRPAGSTLHLGMRRSPIRTPKDAAAFAKHALSLSHVAVVGLMGYEAHIAGPNDAVPHKALKNTTLRLIKRLSIHELTLRRDAVVEELKRIGLALEIVNGGGSGSLVDTSNDPYVTEITAGSAFYAPALFWHYSKVSFVPSAFFAISRRATTRQRHYYLSGRWICRQRSGWKRQTACSDLSRRAFSFVARRGR